MSNIDDLLNQEDGEDGLEELDFDTEEALLNEGEEEEEEEDESADVLDLHEPSELADDSLQETTTKRKDKFVNERQPITAPERPVVKQPKIFPAKRKPFQPNNPPNKKPFNARQRTYNIIHRDHNQLQRRPKRMVLINPRFNGFVEVDSSDPTRLVWDPQQNQNNSGISPWASGAPPLNSRPQPPPLMQQNCGQGQWGNQQQPQQPAGQQQFYQQNFQPPQQRVVQQHMHLNQWEGQYQTPYTISSNYEQAPFHCRVPVPVHQRLGPQQQPIQQLPMVPQLTREQPHYPPPLIPTTAPPPNYYPPAPIVINTATPPPNYLPPQQQPPMNYMPQQPPPVQQQMGYNNAPPPVPFMYEAHFNNHQQQQQQPKFNQQSNYNHVAKIRPNYRQNNNNKFQYRNENRGFNQHQNQKPKNQAPVDKYQAMVDASRSRTPVVQLETETPEDEEMRLYKIGIEEQKRQRAEVLRAKELRRLQALTSGSSPSTSANFISPQRQKVVIRNRVVPNNVVALPNKVMQQKTKINIPKPMSNNISIRCEDDLDINSAHLSSFLTERRVIANDPALSETRQVKINNLSIDTSNKRIISMSREIGDIQRLQRNKSERQATILFKSVASAHAFFKKYQRFMLDLSMIEVTLIPMPMQK